MSNYDKWIRANSILSPNREVTDADRVELLTIISSMKATIDSNEHAFRNIANFTNGALDR